MAGSGLCSSWPCAAGHGDSHNVPPAAGRPEASSGQQRGAGCSQAELAALGQTPTAPRAAVSLQPGLAGRRPGPGPLSLSHCHSVTQLEQSWVSLWATGPGLVLGGTGTPLWPLWGQ